MQIDRISRLKIHDYYWFLFCFMAKNNLLKLLARFTGSNSWYIKSGIGNKSKDFWLTVHFYCKMISISSMPKAKNSVLIELLNFLRNFSGFFYCLQFCWIFVDIFQNISCLFCPFWVNSWNTFVLFCLDSRWWQIPVFFSCLLLPWGNPQRIYYFATFWWPKKFPTHDFLWFTPTEILSECDLKIQKMKIGGNYQIATWFFPLNLEELNHKQKSYSHWNSEYIMKT